jgi:DNA-binding IscR family transcriptional regulator
VRIIELNTKIIKLFIEELCEKLNINGNFLANHFDTLENKNYIKLKSNLLEFTLR